MPDMTCVKAGGIDGGRAGLGGKIGVEFYTKVSFDNDLKGAWLMSLGSSSI